MTEEKPAKKTGCVIAFVLGAILGLGVGVALLMPAFEAPRGETRRACCANNLKQIELGLLSYHEIYGRFPPAYTVDASGKPLHSWRTLILPFLEKDVLYSKITLDEPWDSPANLAVYEKLRLDAYLCPSIPTDEPGATTNYVMVLPNCVSDGPNSCSLEELRGTGANTLHVVETLVPIRWYEPRDLKADKLDFKISHPDDKISHSDDKTSSGIGSGHPSGMNASFCDGHVEFINNDIDPEELRKMFEMKP